MIMEAKIEQVIQIDSPRKRRMKEMSSRFFQNKLAVIGGAFTLLLILMAIFAPFIAPHAPAEQDYAKFLQSPSSQNLMGTDELGRDIFSRVIFGARVSIQA